MPLLYSYTHRIATIIFLRSAIFFHIRPHFFPLSPVLSNDVEYHRRKRKPSGLCTARTNLSPAFSHRIVQAHVNIRGRRPGGAFFAATRSAYSVHGSAPACAARYDRRRERAGERRSGPCSGGPGRRLRRFYQIRTLAHRIIPCIFCVEDYSLFAFYLI